MVELVEYIAKSLVDNKDAVEVTADIKGRNQTIYLKVDPEDLGKVIGRQGKIANAIRAIVKSASTGSAYRCSVKIVE